MRASERARAEGSIPCTHRDASSRRDHDQVGHRVGLRHEHHLNLCDMGGEEWGVGSREGERKEYKSGRQVCV